MLKAMFAVSLYFSLGLKGAFAHGGAAMGSSLEEEFSATSHLHLPISINALGEISFGLHLPGGDHGNHGGGHHDQGHGAHHGQDHGGHHGHNHSMAENSSESFSVHPMLIAGRDKVRRLVNLETSSMAVASDAQDRFALVESHQHSLGLGIKLETPLPLPLAAAGIGVARVNAKSFFTRRILSARTEARNLLKYPGSEEAFSSWRVGDKMVFAANNALVFRLFVGVASYLHAGPAVAIRANSVVKLEKLEEDLLKVKIITGKSKAIAFESHAMPFMASLEKFKTQGARFTFLLKMDEDQAFLAAQDLLGGDLRRAQALGGDYMPLFSSNDISSGIFRSRGINIPFLYSNHGSRSSTVNNSTEFNLKTGGKHKAYAASISAMRKVSGPLSSRRSSGTLVSSLIRKKEGNKKMSAAVQYKWFFERESMGGALFRSLLGNKGQRLGLDFSEAQKASAEHMGYTRAEFSANFSGEELLQLVKRDTLEDLKEAARASLEEDFRVNGHRRFCSMLSYYSCLERHLAFIQAVGKDLAEMERALNGKLKGLDYSEVAKKLARFAHRLFQSDYWAQAVFERLRPHAVFVYKGEDFKSFSLDVEYAH